MTKTMHGQFHGRNIELDGAGNGDAGAGNGDAISITGYAPGR
jgi:hypothetical protein